jgi:hypothetical protein
MWLWRRVAPEVARSRVTEAPKKKVKILKEKEKGKGNEEM